MADNMKEKYEFFMSDLDNKFSDYKKNPYLHYGKMRKQSLKIRLSVSTLMFFNKIGLDKILYYMIAII